MRPPLQTVSTAAAQPIAMLPAMPYAYCLPPSAIPAPLAMPAAYFGAKKRLRAAAAVQDGAERPAADDRGHGRESDEKGSRGWRDSVEQQEGNPIVAAF